jgi:hypothetical protein
VLAAQGIDPNGLPYVEQILPDGTIVRRLLATLPTPRDHPMRASRGWEAITGIPIIQRQDFDKYLFEERHTELPIINQGNRGKCTCSATKCAVQLVRRRSGAPHHELSDDFLYSLVNHGVDAGSIAGDALDALRRVGIALASDVPGMPPLTPPGINQAAMASAARFRLPQGEDGAIPLNTFEEAFTAVVFRWVLLLDVQAGQGYVTDATGTVKYLGRATNHEQVAGEGLRKSPIYQGRYQILGRNSWDYVWGDQGFGWFTEDHFAASNSVWAVKRLIEDPEDSEMPPPLP